MPQADPLGRHAIVTEGSEDGFGAFCFMQTSEILKTDRQAHGVTGRILTEHIAANQTGAGDDDVILAAVDL